MSKYQRGAGTHADDATGLTRPGFGRGPVMTRKEKCGRITVLGARLLTVFAIGSGSLGLWRVGTDIQWTKAFVIREGFLSHWQVWIGAAVAMQYTSWWLARYAGTLTRSGDGARDISEP